MILRRARAADAAAICAIANALARDTLITFSTVQKTVDEVKAGISELGAAFQVVEHGGKIAGYASYKAFRPGPGYAFSKEHTIALDPSMRGRGLGRALMARLMAEARADDVHVLIGAISAANPAGLAFHASIGFAEVGRLPQAGFKAGKWLDLVLMQKILRRPPEMH
jgi:L-amino acid N-acyltransferase